MRWALCFLAGYISLCGAVDLSDFEDVFSIFSRGKNGHQADNNEQEKPYFPNEAYDTPSSQFIDFMPEPLQEKAKVGVGTSGTGEDQKDKPKVTKDKKPKVIMSFTELFIPFHHKSHFDFPTFPKKLDFFDNIFKDFGFKDKDQQILNAKKEDVSTENTPSKSEDLAHEENKYLPKKTNFLTQFSSLFKKPKKAEPTVEEEKNENKLPACCGKAGCNGRCQEGKCKAQGKPENSENAEIKKSTSKDIDGTIERTIMEGIKENQKANITKTVASLSKDILEGIAAIYTFPILIGIAFTVLILNLCRREARSQTTHKVVYDYGPVNEC